MCPLAEEVHSLHLRWFNSQTIQTVHDLGSHAENHCQSRGRNDSRVPTCFYSGTQKTNQLHKVIWYVDRVVP